MFISFVKSTRSTILPERIERIDDNDRVVGEIEVYLASRSFVPCSSTLHKKIAIFLKNRNERLLISRGLRETLFSQSELTITIV